MPGGVFHNAMNYHPADAAPNAGAFDGAEAAPAFSDLPTDNPCAFIRSAPDEITLGQRFQHVIEGCGYAHYIYAHIDPQQKRLYMIQCTYPDPVRRFWADERVCTRDPLIPHLIQSVTPAYRTDIDDDCSWAEGVFDALREAGIASPAWHLPIHDTTNFIGLFSISAREDALRDLGQAHFEQAELMLPALCLEAHATWVRLTPSPVGPPPVMKAQELDVLNWLSHGKSTEDIAQIMAITDRTVNYHVMRIKEKLGVQTRAHAVASAMRAGLI